MATAACKHMLTRIWTLYLLIQCCAAQSILVLLGTQGLTETHSTFLSDLRAAGLNVETALLTDKSLKLQSWGSWLYDGVMVLSAQQADFGGAIDAAYLVDFVDSGRNLFIATDHSVPSALREVAAELGTDFLEGAVVDHVSHAAGLGAGHLLSSAAALVPAITGEVHGPVLYQGGAMTVSPDSALSLPVVAPEHTAEVGTGTASGAMALVTAMQTRANARFVATASLAMLSDEFFAAEVTHAVTREATRTANRALARELARWAFKRKAMLKVAGFTHHKAGERAPPPLNMYTINDEVTVELELTENDGDAWVPHVSDAVQAQYIMLDPYLRRAMAHDGRGSYSLTTRAPDVYGVFKWVIDYKAPGYTFVHVEEVTPLRPYRHTDYPRFIVQAYPYYVALATLSVGFFVMVTLVMYHR